MPTGRTSWVESDDGHREGKARILSAQCDHRHGACELRGLKQGSRTEGMVPFPKQERDMSNLVDELTDGELEAVNGGMHNRANDPGFPSFIFEPRNGSPLYGNGSFRDTIDNNDNLP